MPSQLDVDKIRHTNGTDALTFDTSGNTNLQKDLKFSSTAAIKNSAGNNILSESGGTITLTTNSAVIEGSSSGDLVRITQTGTGNALVVEDSANPDATPFVITSSGQLLIGNTNAATGMAAHSVLISNDGTASFSVDPGADDLVIDREAGGITIYGHNGTSAGRINFGTATNNYIGSVIYHHTDNSMRFEVNNSERIRIDSSGNVGIGTGSPLGKLKVAVGDNDPAASGDMNTGVVFESGYGSRAINIGVNNTAGYSWINAAYSNNSGVTDNLVFMTGATERMRIDSSGRALHGFTSTISGSPIQSIGNNGPALSLGRSNNGGIVYFYHQDPTETLGSIGSIGNISITTTSTAYNTGSDYRLKEDWQPMSGSIDRLKNLNPVNFAWKIDGSRVDGFLAHEAAEVVPEAVTGEKDAVDDEGNPEYQGIDQSKLVPLLTAALQESIALIESQQSQIDTLTTKTQEQDLTIASLISRIESLEKN